MLVPAFGPHTACPLPGLAGLATVGLRAAAGLLLGSRACGFASVGLRVAEVLPLARACGPCHCWHSGRSWCCLSLEWLACPCWPPGHSRLASTARATAGLPPLLVRVPPPSAGGRKRHVFIVLKQGDLAPQANFTFFARREFTRVWWACANAHRLRLRGGHTAIRWWWRCRCQ